jgi:hypothetical protein
MQDDENTLDTQEVQQESETVEIEEAPTEEPAIEADPKVESVILSPAEYRHFKKWEKSQGQPQTPQPKASVQTQNPSPVNMQELILQDKGVPDELIDELKLRAPKYGGSLIKAQNDPNFIAVKERYEKDKKSENASLPASRGSSAVRVQKTFTTPGLSRDEHKKMIETM